MKIIESDENKFDMVVFILKKFELDINLKYDIESESCEEYFWKMKKMEEVLFELNRIYK